MMTAKRDPQDSTGVVDAVLRQLQRWPDWLALLPLGLLVVAILFLAAYSTSITLRARELEARTANMNIPALRSSLDLIVASTLELEALRAYTATADTADIVDSAQNAAARQQAVVELEPIAPSLTAEPRQHAQDLLREAYLWEGTLPNAESVAGLDAGTREERLAESRERLRGMLMYAASLHSVVRTEIDSAGTELVKAERRAWHFTLGLTALALLASLLVIWMVRRVRWLADVSRRRRIAVENAMANRARLIRGITHDLKNPLAAADGNAQLLQMAVVGKLTEAQETTVRRIRRGIDGALGSVSDLLELNRAESGKLDLDISPTDVAPILEDATDDHGYHADAAGVTLEVDVAPGLPHVVTDGARVRQVLGNLLSNAVKYTPAEGRIKVSARVQTGPAPRLDRPCLALAVADTGPGIRPDEQERIFDEFYRARTPADSPGLGLGLSISRSIARKLGGEITVESEPGSGSVFTLWLPLDKGAARDLRVA